MYGEVRPGDVREGQAGCSCLAPWSLASRRGRRGFGKKSSAETPTAPDSAAGEVLYLGAHTHTHPARRRYPTSTQANIEMRRRKSG